METAGTAFGGQMPATEATSAQKKSRGDSKPGLCFVFDGEALGLWSRSHLPGVPAGTARGEE